MAGPSSEGRRRPRANLFANDLKSLLFAFGDVANPYPETVLVLEDILQEYLMLMCQEAQRVARAASRTKLKVEDFKFALRNDPRKLGRVEKLLQLQREIDEARRMIDYTEGKALAKSYEEPPQSQSQPPPPQPNGEKEAKAPAANSKTNGSSSRAGSQQQSQPQSQAQSPSQGPDEPAATKKP